MYSLFSCFQSFGQQTDTVSVIAYNLLNYPAGSPFTADTTLRNPYFRSTIASTNPDILVVEEILSQAGVNGFLSNVMNATSSIYSAGVFINGTTDSENAIFFKTSKFTFLSNTPIKTALRDINEFKLIHLLSGDTIRIYAVHLKANDTSLDEAKRAKEVDSLRKVTNALAAGSNFIVCGDFNFYRSTDMAYQKLLQVNSTDEGYFIDPISMPGNWNSTTYSGRHTQSTRTRSFGGGSTGGLDDRFDLILYSHAVSQPGGMTYLASSEIAYGNDGNHYKDSINRSPNAAVGQTIANALHYGSDHLPVIAKFTFGYSTIAATISFSLKVYIQGLYKGNGKMNAVLFNNGLSSDSTACDSLRVELHAATAPYSLIEGKKVLLNTSGISTFLLSNAQVNQSYYIVTRGRNSIETWSKYPLLITGNTASYDFTH